MPVDRDAQLDPRSLRPPRCDLLEQRVVGVVGERIRECRPAQDLRALAGATHGVAIIRAEAPELQLRVAKCQGLREAGHNGPRRRTSGG